MKVGTKEFYELQEHFERDCKNIPGLYGKKIIRENKSDNLPAGIFYTDGQVNMLFHAYMIGYSSGKLVERLQYY